MLDVAIIGLDPDWETTYRPALRKLRDRLRVRAVFDAVASRADQAAADFQASVCHGILRTATLPSIRAILVLGDALYRDALVTFLLRGKKPAFLADIATIVHTAAGGNSDAGGPMIVPGLPLRYTPATSRLRELMATRLGAATEIAVKYHRPQDGMPVETAVALVDWCRYLVGTPAVATSLSSDSVSLEFPPARSHAATTIARIEVAQGVREFSATVTCERGTATLAGIQHMSWRRGGDQRGEALEGERDAVVVLLDLFCRRVLGGLVPIPTIDDLATSIRLARPS